MNPFAECAMARETTWKHKKITMQVAELVKKIDVLTYKFVDGSGEPASQKSNAISSDSSERLDSHIIMDNLMARDADLRVMLQTVLEDDGSEDPDEILQNEPEKLVYNLCLNGSFNDALLAPLAKYMDRYLTYGTLYDWYGLSLGVGQAQLCEKELAIVENKIVNLLRTPSIGKRPLQPFGPADRTL